MEFLVKKEKIEASEDGKILGYLNYSLENGILTIYKTLVLPEARGKGVAKELNKYIFNYVNQGVKEIKIICSYSQNFFLQNKSQYKDIKVVLINGENNVCSI